MFSFFPSANKETEALQNEDPPKCFIANKQQLRFQIALLMHLPPNHCLREHSAVELSAVEHSIVH